MNESSRRKPSLPLRLGVMLLLVGAMLGGLVYFNVFKTRMIQQYMSSQSEPPATVSAAAASEQDWNPGIEAVGALRALRAVDLSTEIAGTVRHVKVLSGQRVKPNQVLIEFNDDVERAQLRSLETARDLARTVLQRDRQLAGIQAVTTAQLDADEADLQSRSAQVDAQRALVEKKTIVAPFEGRIGITALAPGQFVNPGDHLANLQDLDHLVIDFSIPQSVAPQARIGTPVEVRVDAWPGQVFAGQVTARNAVVDAGTRNLQVEASLGNPRVHLLPGMFAHVKLLATQSQRLVTVPQTAVSFNPYGAVVFVVSEQKGADGKKTLMAQQRIVKTGPARGDQIAILSGLESGTRIVTSGQLKLHNGTPVLIDNTVVPSDDPDPHPADH